VSASGLILSSVIYLRPCETRHGDFPYCEDMRHGVFSVTKSLGALVAMLRLAERYGDQIFDLKIKEYVHVTADHDGWEDVTFADALNMATGIGEASDERGGGTFWAEDYPGARTDSFMHSTSAADKLDAAFSAPSYEWGQGEVFRYRNMDTFVLAAAMDGLVKSRDGPEADLWDVITAEVLEPIGVMALPVARTEEADGGRGLPLLVSGAFPTVHDIAKIAMLLQNEGRYEGRQILSAARLADALYQTKMRGLDVAGRAGETYHMSFWYFPARQPGCTVDVPRMDGWGGNLVELLPNGAIAFYLSDDFAYRYRELAEAAGEVGSLCPQ
jgi:CubicO group peptidase (beta-lactamase class C family)